MKLNAIRSDISNITEAARLVYHSDRKLFSGRLLLIVLQSLMPLAYLFLLKKLVDHIAQGKESGIGIWGYAAFFCAIYVLSQIVSEVTGLTDEFLSQKLTDYISKILHNQSAKLDLAYYDNAQYHDTLHRAQAEAGYRPMAIVQNLSEIMRNLLSLAGISVFLLAYSSQIIVVLLVASIPSLFFRLLKTKKLYLWQRSHTALFRTTMYFSALLTSRHYAKELRLFNLSGYFINRFDTARKEIVRNIFALSKQRFRLSAAGVMVEGAGLFFIFTLMYTQTMIGALSVGAFVMLFEAFRRGQGYMQGLVGSMNNLYSNKLFISNLFEFLALQPSIISKEPQADFPEPVRKGIRFEQVSFRYPGSDKLAVDGLTFEARPGQVTHITGKNGAGKTTIIKLLCRLYDCTDGAITIDGIDIKRFDPDELRRNIGVIFQDFVQFDVTAYENIALGDITEFKNREAVGKAARASQAEEIIAELPDGYNTMLGKIFEQGEELSMGQWQRIALGRTLFKNAPILVLDEPTSWMDREAQAGFYTQLEKLKENRVVLLISHRETDSDVFEQAEHMDELRGQHEVSFSVL
jgi:ATP-binding cassette, subfamily B, bacterial